MLILQGNVIDIGIDIVDVLRIQDKVLKNIFLYLIVVMAMLVILSSIGI